MTQEVAQSVLGLIGERVRLDAWLDEPGQCRPCHGPIVAKTRLGMIRDYACWLLVLAWPSRFFMRGGMQIILPYAGTHAYTCTCWSKVAAEIDRIAQRGQS